MLRRQRLKCSLLRGCCASGCMAVQAALVCCSNGFGHIAYTASRNKVMRRVAIGAAKGRIRGGMYARLEFQLDLAEID